MPAVPLRAPGPESMLKVPTAVRRGPAQSQQTQRQCDCFSGQSCCIGAGLGEAGGIIRASKAKLATHRSGPHGLIENHRSVKFLPVLGYLRLIGDTTRHQITTDPITPYTPLGMLSHCMLSAGSCSWISGQLCAKCSSSKPPSPCSPSSPSTS